MSSHTLGLRTYTGVSLYACGDALQGYSSHRMSFHNPDIRKSGVSRQCVLVDVREERISEHGVGGNVTTINSTDKPE